jgi:uncharacterized protein (DUF362 family)
MGVNISDLANGFKSNLIIVDAYRVLMRNGPVGGRLSDVELKKVVIATTNTMEADVVAADLFGRQPKEVDFISEAYKKGMGQIDLKKIILKQVTV